MEIQDYSYGKLLHQLQQIQTKRNQKEKLNPQEQYLLTSIEQKVEEEVIRKVRERQAKIPGLIQSANHHKAYWGGNLTPGCRNCLDGTGFHAIRSVSECNLNCKYCYYYGEEKLPKIPSEHYLLGNNSLTKEDLAMVIEKQGQKIQGVAWVFYEPFMDFDKHPSVIQTLAQKGIYQHMYTNGTLCHEDQFKQLADSGLNELRFDLAATKCSDQVIKTMAIARKYFQYVGVEGPMFPEYFEKFMEKRKMIIETGIDHINCAELHIKEKHTHFLNDRLYQYRRGYVSPVYSRQLTYDLLDTAVQEKWEGISIQDCSNETKYYRSFTAGDHFGNSYWKQEMQLPIEWHLDAVQHYDLFKALCSGKSETSAAPKKNSTDLEELVVQNVNSLLESTGKEIRLDQEGYSIFDPLHQQTIQKVNLPQKKSQIYHEVLFSLLKGNLIPNLNFATQGYASSMGDEIRNQLEESGLLPKASELLNGKDLRVEDANQQIREIGWFKAKDAEAVADANHQVVCTKWQNLHTEQIVEFPQKLVDFVQQNRGMALANNREEAIVSSIENLLTLYATQMIYSHPHPLPSFPHQLFENETAVVERIREMEKKGYNIVVKDCLPGLPMQVTGVLIVDYAKLQYSFQLKAGRNIPETVLSLLNNTNRNWNSLHDISCPPGSDENETSRQPDYFKTILGKPSQWPQWLLQNGEEKSELPVEIASEAYNNKLTGEVRNTLGEIWIRSFQCDNLFVVDTLIDGIQDILCLNPGKEWQQLIADYHHQLPVLSSMSNATPSQLKALCNFLNTYYQYFKGSFTISDLLLFNTSEEWEEIETEIFMSMLNYHLGYTQKAWRYIDLYTKERKVFLKETNSGTPEGQESLYLLCTRDYLKEKSIGKPMSELQKDLATIYGKELADEICMDFEDPETIFQSYDLPAHLICNSGQSNIKEVLHFVKQLIKTNCHENMYC
ncbi:MAG: radical SAM protein [Marinifilaceae bacterium]